MEDYTLYILDDYSVHLKDEIKDALLEKGYMLVHIGGGITGDVQINDTHGHHQRINMTLEAWQELDIDVEEALKFNFVTTPFDGYQDDKVSSKLMAMVGEEILSFPCELLESKLPSSIKELMKTIIAPEGVKYKGNSDTPPDEGVECFDSDGFEV